MAGKSFFFFLGRVGRDFAGSQVKKKIKKNLTGRKRRIIIDVFKTGEES